MGLTEELHAMAERGELEAVERSVDMAPTLVQEARRSLATCRTIATANLKDARRFTAGVRPRPGWQRP